MRVGKILWWSDRDNNGIIVDVNGIEYYFDSSVIANDRLPIRNRYVMFRYNESIKDTLCAKDVEIEETKL